MFIRVIGAIRVISVATVIRVISVATVIRVISATTLISVNLTERGGWERLLLQLSIKCL